MLLTARRFTADEYHQMVEAGILTEDDRVELLEGGIVEMSPIGRRHVGAVIRLDRRFNLRLGGFALVSAQNPVQLDNENEPQPDVVLLRPRADCYADALPTARDVLLLVEIADTSLELDRRVKMPLYAGAGVPEAWLVNLTRDEIIVNQEPGPDGYRLSRVARRGETIRPLAFPDVEIAVVEILGDA